MKTLHETLLDSNFDIDSDILRIDHNYEMTLEPTISPGYTLTKASKCFNNISPDTKNLGHVKLSKFGKDHIFGIIIDWLAAQPLSCLDDKEFTKKDPELVVLFNKWMKGSDQFELKMVKMGSSKAIYIFFDKAAILCIRLIKN